MNRVRACLAAVVLALAAGRAGAATVVTPLYQVAGQPDAAVPFGALAHSAGGTFYGASYQGGAGACTGLFAGCGAAFELTLTNTGGVWSAAEQVIYSFQGGDDGQGPEGGLTMGPHNVLYGTTTYGGTYGAGTFFALAKTSGTWTKTTLLSFAPGSGTVTAPLLLGSDGAIYATTGQYSTGSIFRLVPPSTAGGSWTQQTIYNFPGGAGGQNPYMGLIGDPATALYGTTLYGGTGPASHPGAPPGCGTVFQVTQTSPGVWNTKIIYSFQGSRADGANPGNLAMDANGTLYGALTHGGRLVDSKDYPWGDGLVFALAPTGPAGSWSETLLRQNTGAMPYNPVQVAFNSAQNRLWVATNPQDADASSAIYTLTSAPGGWLFRYRADGGQGEANPYITLWGTKALVVTSYDGGHGAGSVFMIQP